MPSAAALASIILSPPPSGSHIHTAAVSTSNNHAYTEILPGTLEEFESQDITNFKAWLSSVPFEFADHHHHVQGYYMESEGDVRLYLESAIVLTCWPIILAMSDAVNRNFDWALRSEKTLAGSGSRPDIWILQMTGSINNADPRTLGMLPVTAVEFKAPGIFNRILASGQLNAENSDDWSIVTAQIRKYAMRNSVSDILVMDNEWCVYLQFSDPESVEAACRYTVAPVGATPQGFNLTLTARELFLFAVYNGFLASQATLR
jgi:hypothetical protein